MKPEIVASILLSLMMTVVLPGPAPAASENDLLSGDRGERTDYTVGAGDLLEIAVWKNEEISGEYLVRPDGKFSMPLIGDVLAEGKTTEGINQQILHKLKLFLESPYVSTIVRETNSNRVYLLGEVVQPGTYIIEGSMTVLQALSLAGGFTQFADRNEMVLIRNTGGEQRRFVLSYRDILREPLDSNNMILMRGDTLVVP